MKTAVSIRNDVFEEAEHLAKHLRKPRSEVYSLALAEYVARHVPDRVTEAMNRVVASWALIGIHLWWQPHGES